VGGGEINVGGVVAGGMDGACVVTGVGDVVAVGAFVVTVGERVNVVGDGDWVKVVGDLVSTIVGACVPFGGVAVTFEVGDVVGEMLVVLSLDIVGETVVPLYSYSPPPCASVTEMDTVWVGLHES